MEAECELAQIRYPLALQPFFLYAKKKTQNKIKKQQQHILVVTCQLVKNGTIEEKIEGKRRKKKPTNQTSKETKLSTFRDFSGTIDYIFDGVGLCSHFGGYKVRMVLITWSQLD